MWPSHHPSQPASLALAPGMQALAARPPPWRAAPPRCSSMRSCHGSAGGAFGESCLRGARPRCLGRTASGPASPHLRRRPSDERSSRVLHAPRSSSPLTEGRCRSRGTSSSCTSHRPVGPGTGWTSLKQPATRFPDSCRILLACHGQGVQVHPTAPHEIYHMQL
jgi:hypothetical protein